jgi:hypothetical protein
LRPKPAAAMRIEAVRRIFPKICFNEATTEAGRDAHYHEKKDEQRSIGLGPQHDWSSHCADAFGLMAICYEEPSRTKHFNRVLNYPKLWACLIAKEGGAWFWDAPAQPPDIRRSKLQGRSENGVRAW